MGSIRPDEDHVGPALEEAYLLERLVEDLRLLTLAESHQLTFEKHELDLIEIARRSISMFQAEADEKKISLESGDIPGKCLDRCRPAAHRAGDRQPALECPALCPRGRKGLGGDRTRQGNEVAVSINDNGPGIPEADLPFIFNRFWRGEKSRARQSGGAGLGLAITKLLVEGQGGQIVAQRRARRWAAGARNVSGCQLRRSIRSQFKIHKDSAKSLFFS